MGNYESESNKKYERLHITVDDETILMKLEELKNVLLKNNIPREKVCVDSILSADILFLLPSQVPSVSFVHGCDASRVTVP